ncbi:unnamed protein product [Dicrocoelium dendriticum]|nr:unnamed protein product [Dicrocoelium dendriticum]
MAQTPSPLELMIEKFLELDTNKDEKIDRNELYAACSKAGLKENEVDEWMNRYDYDNDGKLSLNEFCRGLGLRLNEMRAEREERTAQRSGTAPTLKDGVQIIASTMSLSKQVEITNKFVELVEKTGGKSEELQNVARDLKAFLDSKYGRVWQVVVLNGSYWMNYSHEPLMSMQFKYEPNICLLWRTPNS